jgi:T-complex protein 1 subunit theta
MDAMTQVVSLAGELLANAEELVREGLHPSDIVEGYGKSAAFILELLPLLVVDITIDLTDEVAVAKALMGPLASKQFGFEHLLAPLVAKVGWLPYPSPVTL